MDKFLVNRPLTGRRFRFAEFELDPENHVLRRHGLLVKIAPQPFKALTFLVSRGDHLVTRTELHHVLWGDDVVVDFEHGLNTCVRQLRTVLGDTGESSRIIETIPRVGYRLRVAVSAADATTRIQARWLTAVGVLGVLALAVVWIAFYGRAPARAPARPPPQVVAELLTRGHAALGGRTVATTAVARALFERAITLDSTSAEAFAGIAATYLIYPPTLAGVDGYVARTRAAEALDRAFGLNPSSPGLYITLAELKRAQGDWPSADMAYRRALAIAPDDARVNRAFGLTRSLEGDFAAALTHTRRAVDLDPLSAQNRWAVALVLRFARRYDEGGAEARRALDLDPTYGPALHTLAQCEEALGRFDRAIALYERSGEPTGSLGHAYAAAGRTSDALALIRQFERRYVDTRTSADEIAQVYLGIGDRDRAFEWLRRARANGYPLVTLKVADVWDPLRPDPRFQELLRQVGLAEAEP
jgi:DNA-binding winged helix-turn-helix (wHTH) protein/tetratricopeptide (TPR) repeat protein